MGIAENNGRKIINHDFVQGQGNQPWCQRFALTTPQQALLWTPYL